MNPHNHLIAIDPPRKHPPRRWRCAYCFAEGTYREVQAMECTYVYPPCEHCGQTPTCAPDCKGVLGALGGDGVYVAGLGPPKPE